MLSPLEATNGLLFFGMSTAVLFAIMSQLIATRLRSEAAYQTEATGKWAPPSVAGDHVMGIQSAPSRVSRRRDHG